VRCVVWLLIDCWPELLSRCSLVSLNSEDFNVPCAPSQSPIARMVCRGTRGPCKERPGECLTSRIRALIHRSMSRTPPHRLTGNLLILSRRGSLSPRVAAHRHRILALRPTHTAAFLSNIRGHHHTRMEALHLSNIRGHHHTRMAATANLGQPPSPMVAMANLGRHRNHTTASLAQPRSHFTGSRRSTHNRPCRRIHGAG
jgi:hypothetical protein